MPGDVTSWLKGIGLEQYAEAFLENAIEWSHLPDLDDDILQAVGVKKVGHRMTILKAAASLSKEAGTPSPDKPLSADTSERLSAWERRPGERKPVTMLFADITGSTALTERLDAEETHDLLYGATQRMCAAVENNRGTVCRFMGDGVMAMFGAPVASEHHALEACEAALEMQQAIYDYATEDGGSGLQIRVGLHSGEVVVLTVGEGERVEYDASGPTVPIAARMEQSAEPGKVYLTAATAALAGHRIETEALEPISVKGVTEPVSAFALRRVRSVEERVLDDKRTPFVGRRIELNQFKGILDVCMEDGHGQTIYVRGEPGIGKTRLVEEFATIALANGLSTHRGLVLPFGVGKGQDAVRSLVRSLLGIAPGAGEKERLLAAQTALADGRLESAQAVFLYDLLDLPQPTAQKALYDAMENANRNEGKQVVVSALVSAAGSTNPLLVTIEDVHWADARTLAHLAELTKTVADSPALLVMTSRIDGDQLDRNWLTSTEGSPFTVIELGPLRKNESIALIEEFIDASDSLAESCLERSAGNPLFLEQLLRNAHEGTTESLPDSIQSLVLARMDRLDPEGKRTLQAASVLGQRFDGNALGSLLDKNHYDVQNLVNHNLVRPEGPGYLFAHALLQEGVYASLIKSQRRNLHRKAAEWFAGSDLRLHAQHLERAGDKNAASAYLNAAREQAQQYRFETALALIERGLGLTSPQPDRHLLTCVKANLLLDLGDTESSIAVYRQAETNANDERQLFDARMGQAACFRMTTDYNAALELLEDCEQIAARHDDLRRHLSRLHHLRGNLYFPLGKVDECREQHQRALHYARDTGLLEDEARALGGLGDAAYAQGRMQSAYEALDQCVTLCRQNGFGKIEVANRSQVAHCAMFLGNPGYHLTLATDARDAAARVGHRRAEMSAVMGMCHALLDMGNPEPVEPHIEYGLGLTKDLGARAWEPSWLLVSGLVQYQLGDSCRALELLKQGLEYKDALTFSGGQLWGALAMVTDDPKVREHALSEGQLCLRRGTIGSNHLIFYRFALEGSLNALAWDDIERFAQELEEFTRPEPLAGCDFFIARARALSTFGRGSRDDATMEELQRLRDEADRVGLKIAIPALDKALSSTGAMLGK